MREVRKGSERRKEREWLRKLMICFRETEKPRNRKKERNLPKNKKRKIDCRMFKFTNRHQNLHNHLKDI